MHATDQIEDADSPHDISLQKLLRNMSVKSQYGRTFDPALPTAAVILDEFSTACFQPELNLVSIGTQDIPAALDHFLPSFLLCESAWRGNDYAWQHLVASRTAPKPKMQELIEHCRERNIPTVFWNKEDPPHFEDFIHSAKLFDYIYTTEESLIPEYRKAAGHENVDVLPFAAQPRIHKPERVQSHREGNVVFAGQYFTHKFPERRAQMEYLFQAAAPLGFTIFSREQSGDIRYRFPPEYEAYIQGSLAYDEMLCAYRQFKIFLNVNSVTNSQSMCARRIFELSASKTVVLSSPTPAIDRFYKNGEVLTADDASAAEMELTKMLNSVRQRQRRAHLAWRTTLKQHTYTNRVAQIRNAISVNQSRQTTTVNDEGYTLDELNELGSDLPPYVGYILASSQDSAASLMVQASQQSHRPESFVLVALTTTSNFHIPLFAKDFGSMRITVWNESETNADELPKVNADQTCIVFVEGAQYSQHYAEDLCLAFKHTNFAVVGKRVTLADVDESADLDAYEWLEDVPTDRVKAFAWASRNNAETRALITATIDAPMSTIPTPESSYATDRYNALPVAVANDFPSSEWEV